uniref:Uncharacterized protein n=1 Tax=Pyramimonas obovata TaxID=1411642 RepID=A0A7S0RRN2_9CHLO|mmetsp:Transcript_5032/g.10306  ORF Transcript_5032/g.10306 Transcript_5032/m.10306 type:complete len:552 (+) Transcript_5032:184-1839(+)
MIGLKLVFVSSLWAFGGILTPSSGWFLPSLTTQKESEVERSQGVPPVNSTGTFSTGHLIEQHEVADVHSDATVDMQSMQSSPPASPPNAPFANEELNIANQVQDIANQIQDSKELIDRAKTIVNTTLGMGSRRESRPNAPDQMLPSRSLETAGQQSPPPAPPHTGHLIVPVQADDEVDPLVPQDDKFKTAFEIYDRSKAISLSDNFQAFCEYKHLHANEQVLPPAESPDFVIGLASGYKMGQVVGFVVSLRASGFKGSIVLGVDGGTMRSKTGIPLKQLFAKHSVTYMDLGRMQLKQYAQVCRYVVYKEWIEHLVPANGRVLVSDVRDVFFQANPFEALVPDKNAVLKSPIAPEGADLLVFEETRGAKNHTNLNSQKLNRRWITEAYSGDPLGLRGNSRMWVLCSGTTMGTKQGMMEYTLRMTAEIGLCRQRHPVAVKRGRMLRDVCISGADQAFHNVLYYRNQLRGARAIPNGQGQVYTVGIFGKVGMTLKQDSEGYVVNPDGQRVPTIHQLDNYPDVMRFVHKAYLKSYISEKDFMAAMTGGARYSVKG